MNAVRILRHLFATHWGTRRRFPPAALLAIESAIRDAESGHGGEIRFAVETALDLPELLHGLTPRQRAAQVFAQLGIWDTAQNNGVLIYVLLADRIVEIVADRGIAAVIQQSEWEEICRQIERQFGAGRFIEGSVAAVQAAARLLARHFPAAHHDADELPNQPVLL